MHLDSAPKGSPGPSSHSMVTIEDQNKKHDYEAYSDSDPSTEQSRLLGEGPSQPLILEAAPGYEELAADLPPDFAPYHASYEITSTGDIFSHDPHLNEDGEALYRFLLSHANTSPTFILKCRGTHPETRVRHVTRTETTDGRTVSRTEPEMYTETVVDFDFAIDISRHLLHPPVLWTVPDDEPAYRGRMKREVLTDAMGGVRRVSRRVLKAGNAWREQRERWGLPPWLSQVDQVDTMRRASPLDERVPMRSELTLRQWADRYCASHKSLKSFTFSKVVYGWNFEALTQAVHSAIQRASHVPSPTYTIQFTTSASKISVRPSSRFSRALSKTWVLVLLWITLVYPFIWLYRRFRGGRWQVAGSAFPLRAWQHCQDSLPGESADQYRHRTSKAQTDDTTQTDDRVLAETPDGVSQLVGTTEQDWFQTWESTIMHCVATRVHERAPLVAPYGVHTVNLVEDALSDGFASLESQRNYEYAGFANFGI